MALREDRFGSSSAKLEVQVGRGVRRGVVGRPGLLLFVPSTELPLELARRLQVPLELPVRLVCHDSDFAMFAGAEHVDWGPVCAGTPLRFSPAEVLWPSVCGTGARHAASGPDPDLLLCGGRCLPCGEPIRRGRSGLIFL